MKTHIDPITLAKAAEAAERLRAQLHSWICRYQTRHHNSPAHRMIEGNIEISRIEPDSVHADQIGLIEDWGVRLKPSEQKISKKKKKKKLEDRNKTFLGNVDCFVPRYILYHIFRSTFGHLGVPISHPSAVGNYDEQGKLRARTFIPGLEIQVKCGEGVFVRPCHHEEWSAWTEAEIRIDFGLKKHKGGTDCVDELMRASCNVDPFGVHYGESVHAGRDSVGNKYEAGQVGMEKQLTFYVHIGGESKDQPLARLVGFDLTTGTHTFLLDKRVGLFVSPNNRS